MSQAKNTLDARYRAALSIGSFLVVVGGSWGAVAPDPYHWPGFAVAGLGLIVALGSTKVYNRLWEKYVDPNE